MSELFANENNLAQTFSELSRERNGGAIFLIENGLSRDELEELSFLVTQRAERHQFAKKVWVDFPLSLSVVVTEVAYEYRGTGTDFWPLVETALKTEIPVWQRSDISEIFRESARRHRIATPMVDAWSSAFPYMAWPVRNAMVPREIHAPLARLVREFLAQSSTLSVTRTSLPGLRDLARGFGSKRLQSWLEDDDLALAVIGHLVSGRTAEMTMQPAFLERLGRDLRSESEVRRLERTITARRLARHQGVESLPKATYELLLSSADAKGLVLRGPRLAPAELEAVALHLDRPLSSLTLTVGPRSISLESFLDGNAVFIGRPTGELPNPHLAELDVPKWLTSVLRPAPSLLFRDQGDDGLQPQLRISDRVTAGIAFYEMQREDLTPETWGDGLYHFVSGTPEGDAALARHGVHVEAEPLIDFLGGLTLHQEGDTVAQAAGRQIRLKPRRPLELLAERIDQHETFELSLTDRHWTPFPRTEGIWTLMTVGLKKSRPFELVFRETEPPSAVSLALEPEGVGLAELARGSATLHLFTPITLHDVEIEVTLAASDGQSRKACMTLPATPARLSFDVTELREMRGAARLWTGGGLHARLSARAPGLDRRSWALTTPEPEWSLDHRNGLWAGNDDTDVRGSKVCDPQASATRFRSHEGTMIVPDAGFLLVRPNAPGDASLRSAILLQPTLGTSLANFPKIVAHPVARLSSSDNDSPGLVDGLDAYLSWSLATVSTTLGEGVRAHASAALEARLVAALCGDCWAKAEEASRAHSKGFHARLVALASEHQLVSGTTAFSPLDEDQELRLLELLKEEFRKILPAPDLIVIPEGPMWPELDDAVIDAWQELSDEIVAKGGAELEFDAGEAEGGWQKVVTQARDAARLPKLMTLMLPERRAAGLARLPYESSSIDDLVTALLASHLDMQPKGSRWITPADLRALLLLFLAPERVMDDPEWRGRILRFGADRFTARAVRYTALRYRALRTAGL